MTIEAKKSHYGSYSGRIKSFTVGKPSLNSNQIAVAIKVTVPIAFFERLTPIIEIELPSEAVVNPNVETVVKLSALEIADKLHLEVTDVEDGLMQLINKKNAPQGEDGGVNP